MSKNLKRHRKTCMTDRKYDGARKKKEKMKTKISNFTKLTKTIKAKKFASKKDKGERDTAKLLRKDATIKFIGRIFIDFLEKNYKAKIDEMRTN